MTEQQVMVTSSAGLHARPASLIVQEANNYQSEIKLAKDNNEVNAKSIMGIMGLGVSQQTEITVKAEGEDEEEAVAAVVKLIESGFDE
ncbi:HPr family phosphocarrier protein [Natroniella sulfidigena]|uniref:HPr family phosphocarrier protein n=1 Tax=Natroniella sulfidigena TaxID=723921 RepID=UPI00200A724A|nr:HPr family phosphocarrier protein [Natroniella sulfidigena]MCK8816715.1 HPr family phosphocarrier protein [Natroniella sulfidigena]